MYVCALVLVCVHMYVCVSIVCVRVFSLSVCSFALNSHADMRPFVLYHNMLVTAGDLNAVSGFDLTGFEQVVGPFGSGIANDNTIRLLLLYAITAISVVGS